MVKPTNARLQLIAASCSSSPLAVSAIAACTTPSGEGSARWVIQP